MDITTAKDLQDPGVAIFCSTKALANYDLMLELLCFEIMAEYRCSKSPLEEVLPGT